jgi:hypothetical protein
VLSQSLIKLKLVRCPLRHFQLGFDAGEQTGRRARDQSQLDPRARAQTEYHCRTVGSGTPKNGGGDGMEDDGEAENESRRPSKQPRYDGD